jgi:multiple sugar transport system substrate-binding protein
MRVNDGAVTLEDGRFVMAYVPRHRWVACILTVLVLALPSAAAQPSGELVIAGRDGVFGEALDLATQWFREEHPDVTIELLRLPYAGLYENLVISLRERSGAFDVVMLDDTWAPEFMAAGWLRDLDEAGMTVNPGFVERALDASRHPYAEGPLYAVPHVGNVLLFAYRQDLFDAHGLERPESWTDVLEAARTIGEQEEGVHGVVFRGIRGNPIVTGFLPLLWAHGGEIVTDDGEVVLDSAETVAAMELFLALKQFAPVGVEVYDSSEVRDALQRGDAAMAIEIWPSWIPALDDPAVSEVVGLVEIMPAPGQTVGPSPMLGSWLLGVASDAPNPDAGLAFLEFVTSDDVQRRLALEVGLPPTVEAAYTDADVVEMFRWYPAQLEALRNARARPRIPQWSQVESILGDYLQFVLIEQMTPERAATEAHARIEAALAR